MSIKVTSTTEPTEVAAQAVAIPSSDSGVAKQSAPAPDEQVETGEESETSDDNLAEDVEGKDVKGSESDDDDTQSKEEKPKRNGFSKRISKLTNKISEKERELEYWKNEALKSRKTDEPQAPKETQLAQVDGKPKADDYETAEAYYEALADWKVEQKLKEKESKQKEIQVKSEFEKQITAHRDRVRAFADAHDDFDDLMEQVNDVPVSLTVSEVILASENGPELMYELAKNKEEFARICALPSIAAARELGKIEARIAKQIPSKQDIEPKTTKAPAPIAPVGRKTSGAARKSIFDPDLSQAEYERLRQEQTRRA